MPDFSKICVIIPCHNEEGNVKAVIDDLAANLPEAAMLVVDDASSDETFHVAISDSRVQVLSLPINIGVGGGIQTGFKYAIRHGFKYAVKFDGDGQHRADEIRNLLAAMEERKADVAVVGVKRVRNLRQSRGRTGGDGRRRGSRLFGQLWAA